MGVRGGKKREKAGGGMRRPGSCRAGERRGETPREQKQRQKETAGVGWGWG